jgi:hypothetical protein
LAENRLNSYTCNADCYKCQVKEKVFHFNQGRSSMWRRPLNDFYCSDAHFFALPIADSHQRQQRVRGPTMDAGPSRVGRQSVISSRTPLRSRFLKTGLSQVNGPKRYGGRAIQAFRETLKSRARTATALV